MTTKTTIKTKTHFTRIANTFLRNPTISLKAKGMLSMALSHCSDWRFNNKTVIKKHCLEGPDAYYNILNELLVTGYARRTMVRENGKFKEYIYEFSDEPIFLPPTDSPGVVKQDIKKNNSKKNKIKHDGKDEEEQSAAIAQPASSSLDPSISLRVTYGRTIEDWFNAAIEKGLKPKNSSNGGFTCLCPVHNDETPSLSVKPGSKRPVVAKCHAGCEFEDVCTFLFNQAQKPGRDLVFVYTDENDQPRFRIRCNKDDKSKQCTETLVDDKWISGLKTDKTLFRLHKVKAAIENGETILVVEGEKDVETAERFGYTATCNPFGAAGWQSRFAGRLAGSDLIVVRDRDEAGVKWANDVVASVEGKVTSLKVLVSPLEKSGADFSDHFEAGLDMSDFELDDQKICSN